MKGDAAKLRTFLAERGGRLAAAGSEVVASALRLKAAAAGRSLKLGDSRVAAAALPEGAQVLTRDGTFQRFLASAGISVAGH